MIPYGLLFASVKIIKVEIKPFLMSYSKLQTLHQQYILMRNIPVKVFYIKSCIQG